jgi:hypothetical protein
MRRAQNRSRSRPARISILSFCSIAAWLLLSTSVGDPARVTAARCMHDTGQKIVGIDAVSASLARNCLARVPSPV